MKKRAPKQPKGKAAPKGAEARGLTTRSASRPTTETGDPWAGITVPRDPEVKTAAP